MSEQGGNHKVMNAAFEQTSRKCVAQIVRSQIFNPGPVAGGGEAFRDCFYWLALAIGEEPLTCCPVISQDLEDGLCLLFNGNTRGLPSFPLATRTALGGIRTSPIASLISANASSLI
jgi:hypothetical protein